MRVQDLFRCEIAYDGSWVVALFGELDIATAPTVEGAVPIVRAVGANVMLDLRGLQFIDATGVHLILKLNAAIRREGFDLCVVTGGGIVQRVLVLTGVAAGANVVVAPRVEPHPRIEYAVIATDIGGLVTTWNDPAERLYGWSALEVLGRPVMELIVDPQDRQVAEAVLESVQRDGQWEGEIAARTKTGTRFQAHLRSALIKDRNGNFIGFVGISVNNSHVALTRT